MGLRPRSFSKWIKTKVKNAVSFISSFEATLVKEAKIRNCHTVICGHIHTPADKQVDGIRYVNTGDWIENFSFVTIYEEGMVLHQIEH